LTTIEYTQTAIDDFGELIQNIYNDKPTAAKAYFERVEKAIENLAFSPLMGVECSKKNIKANCRVLIVDNYLVFYTYNSKIRQIKILHIVYGNVEYKKFF
jgi:plasmid stabilization system protein ParE